jgi:hypothetical protein
MQMGGIMFLDDKPQLVRGRRTTRRLCGLFKVPLRVISLQFRHGRQVRDLR